MVVGTVVAFGLGWLLAQGQPPINAQPKSGPAGGVKDPHLVYGFSTRVRTGDEPKITGKTKKIGVEVYRDENNGNLIYVSETGSISVVPAK
jgi:hypothetical protein